MMIAYFLNEADDPRGQAANIEQPVSIRLQVEVVSTKGMMLAGIGKIIDLDNKVGYLAEEDNRGIAAGFAYMGPREVSSEKHNQSLV
jgi:hypothetical protein